MKSCRFFQRYILAVLFSYPVSKAEAVLPTDSVDTYSNHTITDSVYVQGRSTLTISEVSVSSGGHLVASSPECIVVTSGMVVELGGRLNLYEKLIKQVLITYDASGNIIRRKKSWQAR